MICSNSLRLVLYTYGCYHLVLYAILRKQTFLVFNLAKDMQALLYVKRNWTEYFLELCIPNNLDV